MRYKGQSVLLECGMECVLRSPDKENAFDVIEHMRITCGETNYLLRYPEELHITVEQEETMLENMIHSEFDCMISAFAEGKLVGNAGITCYRNYLKVKHRAVLGISIQKSCWGMGIGSLLLKEVKKVAKEMGFTQIELGVFEENIRAQRLYQKFGFEEWGRVKYAYRLQDGSYQNEICMGCTL